MWAGLVADGQELARDTHRGFAGARPTDATYTLPLPVFTPDARYEIVAQMAAREGGASAGVVYLNVDPPPHTP
jgi:hypothetical protein